MNENRSKRYPATTKRKLLKQADKIGMLKACRAIGVDISTGYNWKREANGLSTATTNKRNRMAKRKAVTKGINLEAIAKDVIKGMLA